MFVRRPFALAFTSVTLLTLGIGCAAAPEEDEAGAESAGEALSQSTCNGRKAGYERTYKKACADQKADFIAQECTKGTARCNLAKAQAPAQYEACMDNVPELVDQDYEACLAKCPSLPADRGCKYQNFNPCGRKVNRSSTTGWFGTGDAVCQTECVATPACHGMCAAGTKKTYTYGKDGVPTGYTCTQ